MTILHFFPALLCLLFAFPYACAQQSLWSFYEKEYENITSEPWYPNGTVSPEDFPRRYVMGGGGYVPCDAYTGIWCGQTNAIFTYADGRPPLTLLNGVKGCVEIAQAGSSGVVGSCLLTMRYDLPYSKDDSLFCGAYMQGTTSATFLEVPGVRNGTRAIDNWEVGIPYLVGGNPTSGGGSKKGKKRKKSKKSESSDDIDYHYNIEKYGVCADIEFSSSNSESAKAFLGTYCREIREPTEEEGEYYHPLGGGVKGDAYATAWGEI